MRSVTLYESSIAVRCMDSHLHFNINLLQWRMTFYLVIVLSSSSDGMSRSGVFITCMSEIERVKVEEGVDIFQTVKTARAQKPHMVASHVSGETNRDKLQRDVSIKWFHTILKSTHIHIVMSE